ncbi:metalloregulator ArsR/SmtB family transcription factor [Acidiphilium iwatense]|uniref:Metalloregulator ArsR/SmtB family transcription factor n=2 Tax=Acidiphilium iwatense TaxID=768198 RepID=A0ABS9E187_9PROT|nr:metalloregulator ArsR/SmtB family transcription factor [Acidiphilium iwatense]
MKKKTAAQRSLDKIPYLQYIGNMEKTHALATLAALAQETRLDIFRLLVQAGHGGLPVGQIGERLGLPSATLSFHLAQLKQAGLISFHRKSRSLIYAVNYPAMTGLMDYLAENCCRLGDGREACCHGALGGPGSGTIESSANIGKEVKP